MSSKPTCRCCFDLHQMFGCKRRSGIDRQGMALMYVSRSPPHLAVRLSVGGWYFQFGRSPAPGLRTDKKVLDVIRE